MIKSKLFKDENPIETQMRLVGLRQNALYSLRKSESCPNLNYKDKKENQITTFFINENHWIRRNLTENSRDTFLYKK